jgi:carbonic anhydrase
MSIYNSSRPANCPGEQSPINLSQSTAKPCDLLCEAVVDNAMVSQANVLISDEGLMLQATSSLGSCKYNGEGYMCNALIVNHPSHHTVENIQADGEVIAVFKNPTGKFLCLSSLFRVNPSESPSTHFFSSFIQYANPTEKFVPVNLGDNWSLSMMMPTNKGYFVYDGSMPWNCTSKTKWIVNKSMINMDATTFALLTKNVAPGSKAVQPIGDREVFFNDTQNDGRGPTAQGDKKYMRFKLVGKLKDAVNSLETKKVDLKGSVGKNEKNILDKFVEFVSGEVKENGVMYYLLWIQFGLSILLGIFAGREVSFIGTYILDFHQNLPGYIYNGFWYVVTFWYNLASSIISKITKKPDPV